MSNLSSRTCGAMQVELEMCSEYSAGLNMCKSVPRQIAVNVESVFDEGMVVYYVDSNGMEYRGAMLTQTATEPSLQKPTKPDLANPLTFVHDHPYSNMKQYAKHVSTKIPPEAMLNWNSMSVGSSDNGNLRAIESRRKLSHIPLLNGTVDAELSLPPQVRRATVLTDPVKEDESSFSHPENMPSILGGRLAKKVANSKMFYGKDNFYPDRYDTLDERKGRRRGKMKKKQSVATRKQQKESNTNGNSTKPTSPYTMQNPCPIQSPFPLKKFSIPIVRAPLHVSDSRESPLTSSTPPFSPLSSLDTSITNYSTSPD